VKAVGKNQGFHCGYKQSELLSEGRTPVLRVGNVFSNKNWYYSDLELEASRYCNQTQNYNKVKDPEEALEIHAEDAVAYEFKDGDSVRVRSRRGQVTTEIKLAKRSHKVLFL